MEEMVREADLVAVSSANGQAVEEEWTKHGLKGYTKALLCQEAGSKSFCISELLKKGYDAHKVCMVGDAPGDRDAAFDNQVCFYPIVVGKKVKAGVGSKKKPFPDSYQRNLTGLIKKNY